MVNIFRNISTDWEHQAKNKEKHRVRYSQGHAIEDACAEFHGLNRKDGVDIRRGIHLGYLTWINLYDIYPNKPLHLCDLNKAVENPFVSPPPPRCPHPPPRTLRPLLTGCTTYRIYIHDKLVHSFQNRQIYPLKGFIVSTHRLSCSAPPPAPAGPSCSNSSPQAIKNSALPSPVVRLTG